MEHVKDEYIKPFMQLTSVKPSVPIMVSEVELVRPSTRTVHRRSLLHMFRLILQLIQYFWNSLRWENHVVPAETQTVRAWAFVDRSFIPISTDEAQSTSAVIDVQCVTAAPVPSEDFPCPQ